MTWDIETATRKHALAGHPLACFKSPSHYRDDYGLWYCLITCNICGWRYTIPLVADSCAPIHVRHLIDVGSVSMIQIIDSPSFSKEAVWVRGGIAGHVWTDDFSLYHYSYAPGPKLAYDALLRADGTYPPDWEGYPESFSLEDSLGALARLACIETVYRCIDSHIRYLKKGQSKPCVQSCPICRPHVDRTAISRRLRFEILKRDGFRCVYCGADASTVQLHADHVHPRILGGQTVASNLVTACGPCNGGKWAIPLDEIALGAAA